MYNYPSQEDRVIGRPWQPFFTALTIVLLYHDLPALIESCASVAYHYRRFVIVCDLDVLFVCKA